MIPERCGRADSLCSLKVWSGRDQLHGMVYRQLQNVQRTADLKLKLAKLATHKYQDRNYEQHFLAEIGSAVLQQNNWCSCCCTTPPTTEQREDELQALFCSELVAQLYIDAGWLDGTLRASRYLPKDFGVGGNEMLTTNMLGGAALGDLLQVVQHSENSSETRQEDNNGDEEDVEQYVVSPRSMKEARRVPDHVHSYGTRLRTHAAV